MKSYIKRIDDTSNMVTSYSLSRRYGVIKTVYEQQTYTPNEDEYAEINEAMYDNRCDIHANFVMTIHKDNTKLGMPLYSKVLVYKVKIDIHVPFSVTAKLALFTDYSVAHVFDLCIDDTDNPGEKLPLPVGEHTLSFGVTPSSSITTIVPVTIDTDTMTVSVASATNAFYKGYTYYSIDNVSEMAPVVINPNPRLDETGHPVPEGLYAEIVGNDVDAGFASIEIEMYPISDNTLVG